MASIPGLQDTITSLFWGELSGKQQYTKGTLFDPSLSILVPGLVLSVGPLVFLSKISLLNNRKADLHKTKTFNHLLKNLC